MKENNIITNCVSEVCVCDHVKEELDSAYIAGTLCLCDSFLKPKDCCVPHSTFAFPASALTNMNVVIITN